MTRIEKLIQERGRLVRQLNDVQDSICGLDMQVEALRRQMKRLRGESNAQPAEN